MSFTTETHGKWILAGEHAVLRGGSALVFPTKDFKMHFSFENSDSSLQVKFEGSHGDDLKLVFWGLIEQAMHFLGRQRSDLFGYFKITSSLPLGAGLGASAALCVGVVRFLDHLGWLEGRDQYEVARYFEGFFHGESSGVDIAVAMSNSGLKFRRGEKPISISPSWQPKLYLSYSGERGATADCVRKVGSLHQASPILGKKVDDEMKRAVEKAESALGDSNSGFAKLAEAIDLAGNCFRQWGLTAGALDLHMSDLVEAGASAVKPTGSGGGGYVLSLWEDEPQLDIAKSLIPII